MCFLLIYSFFSRLESKCSLLRQLPPGGAPAPLERPIQAMELPCGPLGPVGKVVHPRPVQEVLARTAGERQLSAVELHLHPRVKGHRCEEARSVRMRRLRVYFHWFLTSLPPVLSTRQSCMSRVSSVKGCNVCTSGKALWTTEASLDLSALFDASGGLTERRKSDECQLTGSIAAVWPKR